MSAVESNILLKMDKSSIPEQPFSMNLVGPKLHGLKITESQLNYHGSITIDADILERAGLYPLEFVNIWNKGNGSRISTYVLPGTRNSGVVCLNGAAARTCSVGDEVIITAERPVQGQSVTNPEPGKFDYTTRVITFMHDQRINSIDEVLCYRLSSDKNHTCTFVLESESKTAE